MYRILLADDEPIITRGLRKLIPWERHQAEIIGEACDGDQLWQMIQEEQPDIVFSDIAMPHASGLDVIKKINQEEMNVKVVFLSGYQDFEYARTAIQYGAVDYLLKPVTAEELVGALKKAEGLLQKEFPAVLWEEKDAMQAVLRNINPTEESEDIYARFREMGIETQHKYFQGVCFAIAKGTLDKFQDNNLFELLRFSVFKRLQEYLKKERLGFVVKRDDNSSNLILVLPEDGAKEKADAIIKHTREVINEEYHTKLVVGIGAMVTEISEIKFAYKTAKFAFELFYFQQQDTISYQEIDREFCMSFEDYNQAYKEFVQSVLTQEEDWEKRLKKCLDIVESLHYGNRYAAENRCIVLAMDFYRSLKEYGLVDQGQEEYETWMENLRNCATWQELTNEILSYFKIWVTGLYQKQSRPENATIHQVKEYIKAHYAEDLSLEQMAKKFYMNPYYFSTFFKKSTGQNFKSYVTEIRMGQALKILMDEDIKTYELAKAVGYKDVRTFVEKFREVYGKSPSVHKKQYGRSEP